MLKLYGGRGCTISAKVSRGSRMASTSPTVFESSNPRRRPIDGRRRSASTSRTVASERLSQRAGQVDRGGGLAVADPGARDGDHGHVAVLVPLLDHVP